MFSGGSNGAEEKIMNIYSHYVYLNSSSHLNSTGKQDTEEK